MIHSRRWYRCFFYCIVLPGLLIATPSHATPLKFESSADTRVNGNAHSAMAVEVLARKLISASGLDRMLEQIPGAIENGFTAESFAEEFETLPDISRDEVTEQLSRAFQPRRMVSTVSESLSENLPAETMSAALRFLESPVGRKIVEQEVDRAIAAQNIDVTQYGERLSASPFRQERKQVLSELDQAWDLTGNTVDMLIDMQLAMSVAMMPVMPDDRQMDVETLSISLQSQKPALLSHYHAETLNTLFYVYAKLSLSEIREYIAFATSVEGQHYVSAINKAHKRAMMEGSYLWGRELGAAIADSQGVSL